MISRAVSLNKTLLLSTIVHLSMAGMIFGTLPEKKITPIELSFGTFGLSGGGDGRVQGAPPAPRKAKPQALSTNTASTSKTVDEVSTTASAAAPAGMVGEGGTGTAVGDGVASGAGGGNSTDPKALYAGQIAQLIQRNLHYPLSAKKLGQQGIVFVNMIIDKDGKILKVEIKKKSPFHAFNVSSLETIQRVGKFPPIPKEVGIEQYDVTVPVRYILEI
jgi:periplasmic protein TonB